MVDMVLTVGEEKNFEKVHVPMNMYEAIVVDVRVGSPGEFGERVWIDFAFNYSGIKHVIGRLVYAKLTNKTTLGSIVKTLTQKDLVSGDAFNIQNLKVLTARILIKDFKNTKGEVFSVISEILPGNNNK